MDKLVNEVVLQDLQQHLSPRLGTILGSWVQLYSNEHDWVGSTLRGSTSLSAIMRRLMGRTGMVLVLDKRYRLSV
jgi:hypothetical protein